MSSSGESSLLQDGFPDRCWPNTRGAEVLRAIREAPEGHILFVSVAPGHVAVNFRIEKEDERGQCSGPRLGPSGWFVLDALPEPGSLMSDEEVTFIKSMGSKDFSDASVCFDQPFLCGFMASKLVCLHFYQSREKQHFVACEEDGSIRFWEWENRRWSLVWTFSVLASSGAREAAKIGSFVFCPLSSTLVYIELDGNGEAHLWTRSLHTSETGASALHSVSLVTLSP